MCRLRGSELKPAPVPVFPAEIAAARLFPVEAHGKKPLVKAWQKTATSDIPQLQTWAQMYPGCNWGLATGAASGLVVIDVDGVEGRESLAELERQGMTLPATLTVTTGRADGGEHRYYRPPSGVDVHNDQSARIGPHIDVRGTGGFVVCPPSIHASGKHYCFIDSTALVAELPAWVVERLSAPAPIAAKPLAGPQTVGKGSRTKRLVSLAGSLQKRGAAPATIEAALIAENAAKCEPPLPKAKVVSIARDIPQRYPAGEPSAAVVAAMPPMTREEASLITGELLNKCSVWIRRFVVLSEAEVTILTCWLLHTWAFAAAVVTPYIHIRSAEKSSGKTTLMRVLKVLAHSARYSNGISAAALARVVSKFKPTLFIDELDAQMKGDKEKAQDIRGVLNGGFEIDGTYTRCVGKDFDPVDYPTFCPKALAGIAELWDTVESRCIVIEMRRRLPSEKVEAFRFRRIGKDATPIADALRDWGNGGVVELLDGIEVADVAGIDDRQMDVSEPLLQIAQLAGDGWLQRLTGALQTIFEAAGTEDTSTGATLLADIRAIFTGGTAETIASRELATELCEIEGRPWAEWSHGKGLTANNLARQLKRFKIYPSKIRFGAETAQGYERQWFEGVWSRYCPFPPNSNGTTEQPAPVSPETAFHNRNTHAPVPVRKTASNPHEHRAVPVVPVANRGREEKGGLVL